MTIYKINVQFFMSCNPIADNSKAFVNLMIEKDRT